MEEEHADDLADLLVALPAEPAEKARPPQVEVSPRGTCTGTTSVARAAFWCRHKALSTLLRRPHTPVSARPPASRGGPRTARMPP